MGDQPVPVMKVEEFPPATQKRVAALVKAFVEKYSVPPEFVARAPGRVNLIGEHIDYSGYAVLPMAIQQDILVAVAKTDEQYLEISNVLPSFETIKQWAAPVEIDNQKHCWANYFLAGAKGVLESGKVEKVTGVQCMVDGNVPPSAGLSSSSALVCGAALAVAHANGASFTKVEIATICARSEQYIGTEGGGMDQSISFLAEAGKAQFIEFNPIRATPVTLPEGISFVISNTLEAASKYVSAGSCYNKRVVECRLAAQLIAKVKGVEKASEVRTLGVLQERLGKNLEQMLEVVSEVLHPEEYPTEELVKALCIDRKTLDEEWLSPSTVSQTSFQLAARAKHVYAEAARVLAFREKTTPEELGALMNESHASCRDDYACSCPELDQITELARQSGALGSRLTGAGWGGCAVSLVPNDKVEGFLKSLREGFYEKDPTKASKVDTSLFATPAGQGAAVLQL
eukprot:m.494280 g.494280  ORF g.494280 m.494280 type:complete len:458 (+) comp40106_c0_seq1:93-1466(+)